MLLFGSIGLGLVAYLVADIRQRRAFLDTRQSFEMRLMIEEQAREQVRLFHFQSPIPTPDWTRLFSLHSTGQEQLLLSVLPEHVAVKMRQDLGIAHDGQFKKIYMSRHENVRLVGVLLLVLYFLLWLPATMRRVARIVKFQRRVKLIATPVDRFISFPSFRHFYYTADDY